jgi:Ca-activated chloride channel family protein
MNLFGDLNFAHPTVLWVLAALHLLIALFLAGEKKRSVALNRFLAPRLQLRLAGSVSSSKRRWSFFFALAGLTLAIVAAAQPRWGFTWEERTAKGRDLIFAIDTSRSMLAQDLKPDRMSRAKLAAQDLLKQLEGDRVGLIAFAGTAFLQAPLTADYDAIRTSLTELDTEVIPRGGTNLTAAIETAKDAFGKGESEHRALIIFTDGEELEADAVAAATVAAEKFRIFTVGLGSPQGGLIPFATERGGTDFVRDDKGQYVTTRLDEGRLREIAEAGGGFYVHLESGPIEMQRIVRDGLGKMKESQSDSQFSKQPVERYQWPLAGAVMCFVASLLIGDRRRLRPSAAAATVLLFFITSPAQAVPEVAFNQGCEAFRNGDYNTAAKSFSEALGSGPVSLQPQAAYNLANTLARRGAQVEKKEDKLSEWKNSLQHYDRALALAPNYADAQHNREIIRKAIEELEKPEQEQKQDEQKKDDQQKKEDQNKDEEKKDDQNKSQQDQKQDQKGDSQEKDKGEKKEQEKKDEKSGDGKGEQQDQKEQPQSKENQSKGEQGQPKPEEKKEEQKPGEQKSPDESKPGEKKDAPKPEPGESEPPKEGELKAANAQPGKPEEGNPEKEAAEAAAAAAEGRMTPKDAKLLLDAMKKFDERVRLLDPRENQREVPRRGFKNW